ncbi:MAG: PAS domain S-box protein [Actinobacteria bacterium]|nr:PAS domain S-box protein [Actinomycetota bacterium]
MAEEGSRVASGDYFRRLIDYALDVITVLDGEGRVMYNSPSLKRILGYEQDELNGRSCFDFVHPEDAPEVLKAFYESREKPGVSETVEYRFRHKDGSWRYLESVASNLIQDQVVRGLVVSSRDVTDRKRMEMGLRESELMHRGLISISPDAVTVSDLEGNITYVSPQTLKLHGFKREEEMLGMNAIRLAAPEDREKALAIYQMTLEEGAVKGAELAALRRDGSRIMVEMNITLVRDAHGEPRALVAFTRDITDRKRMEMELQNRNEELEAFAHTISHDLLTPVAIVEGYAKAALEADAEGRAEAERECLEAIARGAKRMSELITSLLQYAQAGHADLESLSVDCEEILLEVLMDLEEEIRKAGVSISIQDHLPAVKAEPVKLRQVFSNLIGNALKHMGAVKNPRVEVGAARRKGLVTFHVRDNGVGIPPSIQRQIFEPFKRFSLEGTPGLGIGLSTVKRAVRTWGGDTWVESTPGEGTTFYFTVPAAED